MEELIATMSRAIFDLVVSDYFAYSLAVIVPMGVFGLAYGLMLGRLRKR